MRRRNWAVYIWWTLAALEALMMFAALADGQDTYKHQALMMLAILLCYACDIEERLE